MKHGSIYWNDDKRSQHGEVLAKTDSFLDKNMSDKSCLDMMETDYTAQMAKFVSTLEFADVPPSVVERAKLALLDTIGVILGAVTLPAGRRALALEEIFGRHILSSAFDPSDYPGPKPHLTASKPVILSSALVLGTLSDILEQQDGWRFGGIHACLVIGAALPLAFMQGRTGADLLTALIAGYEITHRAAWACHPQHMASGYMPNGTAGTIGSAACAAWLLDLDQEEISGALGSAAFLLPVSTAENLWSGYSAKPLHTGYAAKTGTEAAFLSLLGYAGCPLEGSAQRGLGYLHITSGDPVLSRLSEGLAPGPHRRYTFLETYFKFYPICRQAQPAAEATVAVSQAITDSQHGQRVRLADIETVTLSTYALAVRNLNRQVDAGSGMVAAQFSLPYIIAATLRDGEMTLQQLQPDVLEDSELLAFSRKIVIEADEAMTAVYPETTPARICVRMKDGRAFESACDAPLGDPRRPVTQADIVAKYQRTCAAFKNQDAVNALSEAVLTVDTASSLSHIVQLMRRILSDEKP